MKRGELLDDLKEAVRSRIDHMFQNLADTYAGSPSAIETAEKHFRDGLGFTRRAAEFAAEEINKQFEE